MNMKSGVDDKISIEIKEKEQETLEKEGKFLT
jgi:hypothetical protein